MIVYCRSCFQRGVRGATRCWRLVNGGFAADVQSSFIFCRSLCAPIVENRSIGIRCAAQIVDHIHIALQRGEQYFCIQGKCRSQWRDLSREAEQNTAKYMEGYYGMLRENGCSVSENRCSFRCRSIAKDIGNAVTIRQKR